MSSIQNIFMNLFRTSLVRIGTMMFIFLCLTKAHAQISIPDPVFRHFLVTYYPEVMDNNEKLIPGNAAEVFGIFDCSERGIKDLTGIQYFVKISALLCDNNQLTDIPSLENFYDSLQFVDCSNNQLTSLPQLKPSAANLREIYFSNNQISDLPDFTNYTGLRALNCANNRLTFDDILAINKTNLTVFVYAPQAKFPVDALIEVPEGETISLTAPFTGAGNDQCKLYKDSQWLANIPVAGAAYQITDARPEHNGKYHWEIRNSYLPELVLQSELMEVKVINKNQEVFTPDGDNKNDSYYISCPGIVRIYNRYGRIIKELQGPVYWDGTDLQGAELPIGTYMIECGNEGNIINVSIVK